MPKTNDEEVESDKVDEGDAKTGDVQVSTQHLFVLYRIENSRAIM